MLDASDMGYLAHLQWQAIDLSKMRLGGPYTINSSLASIPVAHGYNQPWFADASSAIIRAGTAVSCHRM
jgi:hypothetical protein